MHQNQNQNSHGNWMLNVCGVDLSTKTIDELREGITKLNRLITIYRQQGNMQAVEQSSMMLQAYQSQLSAKMSEALKNMLGGQN